ncbi:efflux RND transporter periplasmic adaptor subunit [Photobacterium rosenbergii]|uniref:efflux RND transporter periplasmic adaptor subunit n=1 Tax=Photobacterium rosenbergii TaxID=294936 RepID=UPI0028F6F4DD|nr:efflux RND transporter periplasmic adaptor subunit [Photobacterium rosenbergii]
MRLKGTLISLLLLVVLVGAITYKEYFSSGAAASRSMPTPSVVVTEVEKKLVRREVEALGTVKSRESVVLTAKVTEKVDRVLFEDGQSISRGQLLVTLNADEQQAKVRAAKANLKEQQREYKRIEGLVKRNTIARSELDAIYTDIEVARAVLAQNEAELAARYIHAPFSGVLGFRQISPGALVTPGAVITTLDDIATVKLDFSIPEAFLGLVSQGAVIEASAAAYPDETFKGQIASIDSRINPQTRAIVIRADIANPDLRLRPGMLMTLSLIVGEHQGLVVPEEALVSRQQQHFLFVVGEEGAVEQREVELGFRRRGEAEVVTGIREGEQVITRGTQRVRPGQKVEIREQERFTYREAG